MHISVSTSHACFYRDVNNAFAGQIDVIHSAPRLHADSSLLDDCLTRDYPVDLPWRDGVLTGALQTSGSEFKLAAEQNIQRQGVKTHRTAKWNRGL